MSDNTALAEKIAPPPAEQAKEMPATQVESVVERGDISGVYKIASHEVDSVVDRGKSISNPAGIDAAVAGPEIVALNQADAELSNRSANALNTLNETLETVNKPDVAGATASAVEAQTVQPKAETEEEKNARLEAAALEAMSSGPLSLEDMANDLDAHEAAEKAKTAEATPAEASEEEDLTNTLKRLQGTSEIAKTEKPAESDDEHIVKIPEDIRMEAQAKVAQASEQAENEVAEKKGETKELPRSLEQVAAELQQEQAALKDFESTHGEVRSGIEKSYVDYLNSGIAALQAEKNALETNDQSPETKAKIEELKAKANESKVAYEKMLKEHEEDQDAIDAEEENKDFNMGSQRAFSNQGYGQMYESNYGSRSVNKTRGEVSAGAPPKGIFERMKDGYNGIKEKLKFWKIID